MVCSCPLRRSEAHSFSTNAVDADPPIFIFEGDLVRHKGGFYPAYSFPSRFL